MAVVDSPTVELSVFNRRELLSVLQSSTSAAMQMLEMFAQRIRKLRALLEIRNIRAAGPRIYAWLCLEARGSREIVLTMTYKDVAYQLGLAHETFYRALKQLEQNGRIIRKKNRIQLC